MSNLDWAPMSLPLRRRREMCAVLTFLTLPLSMTALLWLALSHFTAAWAAVGLYLGWWLLFDAATPKRGGRAANWLQQSFLARWAAMYFPVRIFVETKNTNPDEAEEMSLSDANAAPPTSPYPDNKPHIFCLHPHGIIGLSWITTLALDGLRMRERLGLSVSLMTVSANFRIPFYRDLIMAMGLVDACKASASFLLSRKKNIGIVIGGAREAMDAHPTRFDLTINRRRGFVRQALLHGASLVPCVSYGENELFNQLPNEEGSTVRWLQQHMIRWLGFTLPFVYGRGVFQYSVGLLPHRHPLNVIWGQPMPVAQCVNPSEEDIDQVLAEYTQRLQALYERHALRFCAENGNSTTPAIRERWWLAHKAAETPRVGVLAGGAEPGQARQRIDREYESLLEDGDDAAAEVPSSGPGTPAAQQRARQELAEQRNKEGGVFVPPFRVVA